MVTVDLSCESIENRSSMAFSMWSHFAWLQIEFKIKFGFAQPPSTKQKHMNHWLTPSPVQVSTISLYLSAVIFLCNVSFILGSNEAKTDVISIGSSLSSYK